MSRPGPVSRPQRNPSAYPAAGARVSEPGESPRLRLWVQGNPAPKGSRTTGERKDGSRYTRESSKAAGHWVEQIAWEARAAAHGRTLDPPYRISLEFVMPRPKQPTYDWPVVGDVDKLLRAVLDGLQRGGVIAEDKHVVGTPIDDKRFAEPGESPGIAITIA